MNIQVKSKIYISETKKDKIVLLIINIAVVLIAISSIGSIFLDGVSVGNVSSVIVALVISSLFKKQSKNMGHYEFCLARIQLSKEELIVDYEQYKTQIMFTLDNIETIEYSDKLQCLKIVGSHKVVTNEKITNLNGESLIYINIQEAENLFDILMEYTNKNIVFVDKK